MAGKDADDWIEDLQEYAVKRGFTIGGIWLPHDARNKTFATKHSPLERFLKAFGSSVVHVVPQTKIADRINAARRVVGRCVFDQTECEVGLAGLASWRYDFDVETKTMSREPVHDWSSHPGDAFSYGAQMMELTKPPAASKPPPRFLHQMTANELFWQQNEPTRESDGY